MNTIIFYHRADLDGHCSGAIVKQACPDAELYGIDYGDPFPWDKVKGSKVIMVDFSLQPWSEMQRLAKTAYHLRWIDHHKTAIEQYEAQGLPGVSLVVLDTNYAACELAWRHFNPEQEPPVPVTLLGRYDVWDHSLPNTLEYQMGMRTKYTDPKENLWLWTDHVFPFKGNYFSDTIGQGKAILRYQQLSNERLMRCAFITEFAGKTFLAVNAGGINSLAFESAYNPELHDAVMSFIYVGSDGWKISMYSPDQRTDCSAIAQAMGGGGHAYACGFQVKDLDAFLGSVN